VKGAIAVPADAAYFDGHFPGRPILPGVVELLLALEARARERGSAQTLRELKFARLRQLVLPGQRLDLQTRELDTGRTRLDITRQGSIVANAEVLLGPPHDPAGFDSLGHAAAPIATVPPLDALLLHRPPMRFVTAVLGETADGLDCAACVPQSCGLVHAGHTGVLTCVEAAAQTAATWEALCRWREKNNIAASRVGYLVALRDIVFFASDVPAERALVARVRLEAAAFPLAHYRFEVCLEGAPLASGRIATFLTGQSA
jgi:predicted hotdog family 3-hydroxylacyl-ACP dehydratase